ncbi:dihydrofolate reductase family protein [Actinomadura sp. DC4]|uniref:dihydrofolate reductase family protein n=1 Tax=Actinomadura sp. DC4 TaxID=3055069 RepID=UPI0025B0A2BC|nr:dihydrofolate reductase family protein [Actinomadura sp. DC4]MDN3357208.1 dihydrofolate reductase family protein [Actinomadura sp. DC4]
MREIVAGLAMTLDGVVDSPSGNWMMFDEEMAEVIAAGIAEADAILLGRRTYLAFAAMWPTLGRDVPMSAFMNDTPKYVASRTLDTVEWAGSTLLQGDLAGALTELKRRPGKNIQVPGSPHLVRSLLREGLLDRLSLTIHPIVLGTGARLFEDEKDRRRLRLVDSRTFRSGVVSVTYEP